MKRDQVLSWVLGLGILILTPYSLIAETQFFYSDHVGSSTLVTYANGEVIQNETFSPFGESLNPSPNPLSNFKFTGQELDAESALYNYGARFYDAALSRFVSTDPVLGNPPYAYVHNNPIQRIDPNGKDDKAFQELLGRFESSSMRLAEKSLRLAEEATRLAEERHGTEWNSLPAMRQREIFDHLVHQDLETEHARIEIAVESLMAKSLAEELRAKIDRNPKLLLQLDDRQLTAYTEFTQGLPKNTTLHFSSVDGERFSRPSGRPVNLDHSPDQNGGYGTPNDSVLARMGILPGHNIGTMPPPNPWASPNLEGLRESLDTNPGYGGDLDWGSLTGPMLFATGAVAVGLGCTLFPSVCFGGGAAALAIP